MTRPSTDWSDFAGLLSAVFQFNQASEEIQFVIAGGFMFLPVVHQYYKHHPDYYNKLSQNKPSKDVDFFIVLSGDATIQTAIQSLVEIVNQWIEKCKPSKPVFVLGQYTLTISSGLDYLSVQFIIPPARNIGTIITMFDLPCCSWAFDGKTLYTTPEGERSMINMTNYVNPQSLLIGSRRYDKYRYRGIITYAKVLHPLIHLLSNQEVWKLSVEFKTRTWKALGDESRASGKPFVRAPVSESSVEPGDLMHLEHRSTVTDNGPIGIYAEHIGVVDDSVYQRLIDNQPDHSLKTYEQYITNEEWVWIRALGVDGFGLLVVPQSSIPPNAKRCFTREFTSDFSLVVSRLFSMVDYWSYEDVYCRDNHISVCDSCKKFAMFIRDSERTAFLRDQGNYPTHKNCFECRLANNDLC